MNHAEAIHELNNKINPLINIEKYYSQMVNANKESLRYSTIVLKKIRRDLKKLQSLKSQVENDMPDDKTD